jgi:predicted AlkP superfamily phosphohydrolase/phosphomutase
VIGDQRLTLELGRHSDWVPVAFPLGLGMKLRGICRFRLLERRPNFRLYVTPINIDPARPVMPISHPFIFSVFLAKLCGSYAILGLAEDTWALNEGVIDEEAFLEQAWANHTEREAMFFEMLRRTPRGVISCVFDGSDRIQHMFMRYLDPDHPAARGDPRAQRYQGVIADTYARLDQMIGRVMDQVDVTDPRTLVVVLSDHGFKTFRHGVNLNSWLLHNGYLALRPGCHTSGEWFRDVDWSRTRAFALGLGGIFLNVRGREAQGTVSPGQEATALADELAARLSGLCEPRTGQVAITEAFPAHRLYRGPYAEQAPDLVVGYAPGWRASWDGVRGLVDDVVFDDNTRAWSGDHCIDPREVPGVLICNQDLRRLDEASPGIADIAPTLLEAFGIPAPRHMDGRAMVAS